MIELKNNPAGNFFLLAGPCVIEGEEMAMRIAERIVTITEKLQIPYVFKGSYRKANRSRLDSFMGIGDEKALKILTDKDSIGDYVYTYYFGNRIEQGKVKLLSQEGRNAVLLVEYNDLRLWSAKFNATMLTDTTFFLTRQDHEGYYLEDSIVMKREYPKSNTAEIWRSMEEYQTKNEALKEKGVYLK